ncbi:hypothetical protein J2046_004269 [Rhizobium petrolearium]|uniref:hypothetical protein n=1 Tax=Neorhizobium petrolearium TaxID=515361 RepID=UPI001AE9DEDA|nr:hypothetical protein [Neorhizobium petrolearium]MBP1845995.1 hypothetical protein [Neorhizobium petrolearium]
MTDPSLPSLETRISRRLAEVLGMPRLCPRRACRTGCCAAAVSADGEPECVGTLQATHRTLFAGQRKIAGGCAARFSRRDSLPEAENEEQTFILRLNLSAAVAALAEEPANRPALRGWLRRLRLPPVAPPPPGIARAFQRFGRVAEEEETFVEGGQ